jgi:hypothetical protein
MSQNPILDQALLIIEEPLLRSDTLHRNPPDKPSVRLTDIYLTTNTTQKKVPAGFESTISTKE